MKIPSGMTEAEVLKKIEEIVNLLAYNFTFGYYGIDDIKQEARIFGMKAMDRYNEKLPLANFLYVHIRNRLINLIRDKFHRNDPPCQICHGAIDGNTNHIDGRYCEKYVAWKNRNTAKANLTRPLDITNINDKTESRFRANNFNNEYDKQEILELLDAKLDVHLRKWFLKMKSGLSIPKNHREALFKAINKILEKEKIIWEE